MRIEIALLTMLLVACEDAPKPHKAPEWNTEKSTDLNKSLAMEEDIAIEIYLAQHENWKVEATGSGLRFISLKKGTGELAKAGQTAKVQYSIHLLDGTECYKTPADEVDVFKIDRSNIETGIQEGIKKMRVGEKAKLIIPSHIAHGLIGDMDKIPPLTTIVADIELISLI